MEGILKKLEEHSFSVLSRIRQWKELEDNFQSAHYLVEERARKLESLKGLVKERHEKLEAKAKKVEMKDEEISLRPEKVGTKEEEQEPNLKLKVDAELSQQLKMAQELFEKHMMGVGEKEWQSEFIMKRFEVEDLRRMEEQCRYEIFAFMEDLKQDIEGYEYKLRELELYEKEIEEELKEAELKDKRCQERLKEVKLMEKLLEYRGIELYLKEEKPENPPKQKKRSRSASPVSSTQSNQQPVDRSISGRRRN